MFLKVPPLIKESRRHLRWYLDRGECLTKAIVSAKVSEKEQYATAFRRLGGFASYCEEGVYLDRKSGIENL